MAILDKDALEKGLNHLPEWHREGNSIQRVFAFDSFLKGIDFVNRVAEKAEAADHHPDITIKYKKVAMSLSTHSEGGITEKDLTLAAVIDKLSRSGTGS